SKLKPLHFIFMLLEYHKVRIFTNKIWKKSRNMLIKFMRLENRINGELFLIKNAEIIVPPL
ncbi:hypothetical protein, partial [Streptococcus pneumoniae]|uniref:hypothetical protein n=1 Tax=Streptococcus pneumoniae TaxID=1313 RepID=UPI001C542F2E